MALPFEFLRLGDKPRASAVLQGRPGGLGACVFEFSADEFAPGGTAGGNADLFPWSQFRYHVAALELGFQLPWFVVAVQRTHAPKGARRGFAGARPGNRALSGYLDLQRRVDDPRITRSSPYTGRLYVHQFRIRALGELDDEFAGWIHEAYQVGNGAHLDLRPPTTLARLLERGHEGPDAFQGGRGLPDRINLGVEARQVVNALQEPLP